jgi:hypothetical protein
MAIFGITDFQNFLANWGAYLPCDIDDASNPKYYGFADIEGKWYILEENTTNKTYRYIKGSSGYVTNWTNRAILSYDYPFNSLK